MEKSPFEDVGIPQIIHRGRFWIVRRASTEGNVFRNQFIGNPSGTYEWVFNSGNAVTFATRKSAEVALAACLLSS